MEELKNENENENEIKKEKKEKKTVDPSCAGFSSSIYGLAFIGTAVYYIQLSDTFWVGVLGVLKAMIWPAILVYNLFEFLKI